MSIFSVEGGSLSFNSFYEKVATLAKVVKSIKADQDHFVSILDAFDESGMAYSKAIQDVSSVHLGLKKFPYLWDISKKVLEKLRAFGGIFDEVHEKYQKEKAETLGTFASTYYPQLDEMSKNVDIFLQKLNSLKPSFNKPSDDDIKTRAQAAELKLDKIASTRIFDVNALLDAKEAYDKANKIVLGAQKESGGKLLQLEKEFAKKNDKMVNGLEAILKQRYSLNQSIVVSVFQFIHNKYRRMSSDINLLKKHLADEFDAEDDVSTFCYNWTKEESCKGTALHVALNEVDLKSTVDAIRAATNKMADGMGNLLKGLKNGQQNFMGNIEQKIEKMDDSCILNKKLMTMLDSMKDSLNFKAELFAAEGEIFAVIAEKAKALTSNAKTVYTKKTEALDKITKIQTKSKTAIPEMNAFSGFDQNFFDALNCKGKSFSVDIVDFKNDHNTATSIIDKLQEQLEKPDINRKTFLRSLEAFVTHFIVSISNTFCNLCTHFGEVALEARNFSNTISIYASSSTFASYIPTIGENFPGLRLLEENAAEEPAQGEPEKPKIDAALFDRFVGEAEVNKAEKARQNKGDGNFFSFLLENNENGEQSKEFVFNVSLIRSNEKASHKIIVGEDKMLNLFDEKQNIINTLNLEDLKTIRIASSTKHKYTRMVNLSNKQGEMHEFYLFDEENPDRFKQMVTELFQKHIVRKNISKGKVTFKIYVYSQSPKRRKSAEVLKKRADLSMNVYVYSNIEIGGVKHSMKHITMDKCLFKKTATIKNHVAKSSTVIEFDRFLHMDYILSHVRRAGILAKKLNETDLPEHKAKIWFGCMDFNRSKKQPKSFIGWVPKDRDIYFFVTFKSGKPSEVFCKSINAFLNTSEPFSSAFTLGGNDVCVYGFVRRTIIKHLGQVKSEDVANGLCVSVQLKDSLCLLLCTDARSVEAFRGADYEKAAAQAAVGDSNAVWQALYLADHVFWVSNFDSVENDGKLKPPENLWDTDRLNMAHKAKALFPGFAQCDLSKCEPLKKLPAPAYATRLFFRATRPAELAPTDSAVHNAIDGPAFSATVFSFNAQLRSGPLAFVNEENPVANTVFALRLSQAQVELESAAALALAGDRLSAAAMHTAGEWVAPAGRSGPYDAERKAFVWAEEAPWQPLELYVMQREYLESTAVSVAVWGAGGAAVGYATLQLTAKSFAEEGEVKVAKLELSGRKVGKVLFCFCELNALFYRGFDRFLY